jgi:hypothetical protein
MIPRRKLLDRAVQDRDARLYFLIVEGERTEPLYFYGLERSNLIPRHRVKLHVHTPDGSASAPQYLIGKAEELANSRAVESDDEIWLVYDVDRQSGSTRLKQVIQASDYAVGRGWNVAISNPCFELWLLLHVSEDLADVTDHGKSVEELLRSVLGTYNKCRVPDRCLNEDALSQATARARLGDTDPASPIPKLPGTRVYRLIESILRNQLPRLSA